MLRIGDTYKQVSVKAVLEVLRSEWAPEYQGEVDDLVEKILEYHEQNAYRLESKQGSE